MRSITSLRGSRIVIVHSFLRRGGAETQSGLLAYALRDTGATVIFVGLLGDGAFGEQMRNEGFEVQILGLSNGRGMLAWNIGRALCFLRRQRPDILLPYAALPNVYCGLLCRYTGARCTIWNQRDGGLHRPYGFLERLGARSTAAFIANSPEGQAFLKRHIRVPRQHIHRIPNGVQIPPLKANICRGAFGLPVDRPWVTMIGKISREKDHMTLIHAWSLLLRKWDRPVLLLLAGRVESEAVAIRQQCRDLGVEEHVALMGEVEDVPALLACSDLAVFSSRSEGMPNGVLECMAAELALVATDLPGIRACMPPQQRAYLTPPGDPYVLATALMNLLEDSQLRKELGRENRAYVASQFSTERMVRSTIDLVLEAMS